MTIAWAELMLRLRVIRSQRRSGVEQRTLAGKAISFAALVAGVLTLVLIGASVAVAPQLVMILSAVLLALAGVAAMFFALAPGGPIWVRGCLIVVMAHLVLNYGFGNATIGFGNARVPVSELVLVLSLLGSAAYLWKVGFEQLPSAIWLFTGWLIFLLALHLPVGFARDGMPALRDALPTVQAFFVIPGYCIGHMVLRDERKRQWASRFLLTLGLCTALYGLLYPLQKTLLGLSPRVMGLQQAIPLVGYYTSWPTVAVTGMFSVLLWRWALPAPKRPFPQLATTFLLLAGFGLSFLLVQSRGGYVMFVTITLLFILSRGQGRNVSRITGLLLVGVLVLLAAGASGLEVKGRIGQLSLDALVEHVQTLGGESEAGGSIAGAAKGIEQRRRWREESLQLWSADPQSMVLGIGYGKALTSFMVGGAGGTPVIVREPHNSYLTILTRMGAVGFLVMMAFHAATLTASLRLYRWYLEKGEKRIAAFALGSAVFCICNYLNGLGQPNFESPHFVVPYFFLAGVIAALARMSKVDPKGSRSL